MNLSGEPPSEAGPDEPRVSRCGLCGVEPVGPRVTRCGHNFCTRCLTDHLERLRTEFAAEVPQNAPLTRQSQDLESSTPSSESGVHISESESDDSTVSYRTQNSGIRITWPQFGCSRLLYLPNLHIGNFPPNSTLSAQLESKKYGKIFMPAQVCEKRSKEAEIFCYACKIQICARCLDYHQKHEVLFFESAVTRYRTLCSDKHGIKNIHQQVMEMTQKAISEEKLTKRHWKRNSFRFSRFSKRSVWPSRTRRRPRSPTCCRVRVTRPGRSSWRRCRRSRTGWLRWTTFSGRHSPTRRRTSRWWTRRSPSPSATGKPTCSGLFSKLHRLNSPVSPVSPRTRAMW